MGGGHATRGGAVPSQKTLRLPPAMPLKIPWPMGPVIGYEIQAGFS
jgi:hypothetical protein